MKKQLLAIVFPILFLTLSAATVHKFHMALYQIDFAPEKKMLQITSRIHTDDLNKALEKKHNKKITVGDEKQTSEESLLLKDYLMTNFSIKINGKLKPMTFLSHEIDGDELVCYSAIKGINAIKSLEIYNSILTEVFADQQNLINLDVSGGKKSFILTKNTKNRTLKY
jgi:hypothetical protein